MKNNDCKFDHFTLEFLGAPVVDGITQHPSPVAQPSTIYDLTGRRSRPVKGLNIINHQMVVVK